MPTSSIFIADHSHSTSGLILKDESNHSVVLVLDNDVKEIGGIFFVMKRLDFFLKAYFSR